MDEDLPMLEVHRWLQALAHRRQESLDDLVDAIEFRSPNVDAVKLRRRLQFRRGELSVYADSKAGGLAELLRKTVAECAG